MRYWIIDGQLSVSECLLRIIIAGICGALIGTERSRRQKEAGIRTHIIMAMGGAIAMIVSKYGFMDIPQIETMKVDGSRIASNIMTSVGFLGAGVIFVRGGSIKGLTTAAGIWTMAGVSMSIGAGMYAVGIISTLIILVVQIMLHHWMPSSESMMTHEMTVLMKSSDNAIHNLLQYLNDKQITVIETNIKRGDDDDIVKINMAVRIAKDADLSEALNIIDKIPQVYSIKV